MKISITVCLFFVATSLSLLGQNENNRSADEARVRAIIAEQESAWNKGDAKAYSARFQEEGVFTIITGAVFRSRATLEDRVSKIFATVFKNSKLSQKIGNIRFVRPDVAVVDLETGMTGYQGLPPGVKASADGQLRTSMLQVMVKEDGDWWVAAFHNVDVKVP